jgi:hypothetical protein
LIFICQNPYRPELGAKNAGFGYSFTPNWYKDKPLTESESDAKQNGGKDSTAGDKQ